MCFSLAIVLSSDLDRAEALSLLAAVLDEITKLVDRLVVDINAAANSAEGVLVQGLLGGTLKYGASRITVINWPMGASNALQRGPLSVLSGGRV